MTIIYGIDTNKPITPQDVRDALVSCFITAHNEVLLDLKTYAGTMTDAEFERMKTLNVIQLIRGFFTEVGGDFDRPTKATIIAVMEKLKVFAANFRNPEIIQRHAGEIGELVKALSER